jgi:hypothetical protein
MDCRVDNDKFVCQQKVDSCLIDGFCQLAAADNPNDPCLMCDPQSDDKRWTKKAECQGSDLAGWHIALISLAVSAWSLLPWVEWL